MSSAPTFLFENFTKVEIVDVDFPPPARERIQRDKKGFASNKFCVRIETTTMRSTTGDDVAMKMLNHTHCRQPAHWNDGQCQPDQAQAIKDNGDEVRFRHNSTDRCSPVLPLSRPAWRPESAWIKSSTCAMRVVTKRREHNPECHLKTKGRSHRFVVQCEAIRLPLAFVQRRL